MNLLMIILLDNKMFYCLLLKITFLCETQYVPMHNNILLSILCSIYNIFFLSNEVSLSIYTALFCPIVTHIFHLSTMYNIYIISHQMISVWRLYTSNVLQDLTVIYSLPGSTVLAQCLRLRHQRIQSDSLINTITGKEGPH